MVATFAAPASLDPDASDAEQVPLATLIQEVADESAGWVNELLVTIGRASAISKRQRRAAHRHLRPWQSHH